MLSTTILEQFFFFHQDMSFIFISYFVRPSSPTNHPSQDLNLSIDQQELKNELERMQDENAGLKQQLEIQTQVFLI
jgi:hypothetical protein